MLKEGVSWLRSNKKSGSRRIGLQILRKYLNNSMYEPMEYPGFFVFSNCTQWLRTTPYIGRSKLDPEDADSTGEDHCYDETRYMILHMSAKMVSQGVKYWK